MLLRIAFGTFAYMAAVFPLAYVWHLVLFREKLEGAGYFGRAEPLVPLGFLAILLQGIIVSVVFERLRPGAGAAADALVVCVPMMALIWSAQVLAHAAKFDVRLATFIGIETAYFVLQAGLVWIAFALVGYLAPR